MKIGEIYCMNLFDFLENWHPNTLIIVEAEDNIIFEGTVKDIPLEISCKYWVQEGTVRKDGEKVVGNKKMRKFVTYKQLNKERTFHYGQLHTI